MTTLSPDRAALPEHVAHRGHAVASPGPTLRPPRRSVRDHLTLAWRDAAPRHPYQRVMYQLAVLMAASAVLHGVVWLVDGGAWDGPVSWRKPIVFSASFATTFLAVGWLHGVLPLARRLGWWTTALVGGGGVVETVLITGQRWRGVPSHFNTGTALDTTIFALMGVTIAMLTVGLIILTGWSAVRLRSSPVHLVAAAGGLGLMLVGSAIGQDLISRGNAVVEATGDVPFALTVGAAGSGKLAHAVALHGLQVLAIAALLLGRSPLQLRRRILTMSVATLGYVMGTGLIAGQAYAGRSMLELAAPTALALTGCAVLVVGAMAYAVLAPASTRASAAP
jgi:hypothetical protein